VATVSESDTTRSVHTGNAAGDEICRPTHEHASYQKKHCYGPLRRTSPKVLFTCVSFEEKASKNMYLAVRIMAIVIGERLPM
jgi:hypothetical protein